MSAYAGTSRYRLSNTAPQANVSHDLDNLATPSQAGSPTKFLSTNNPVTVFVGIAAVALGFIAFGTNIRVGNSGASFHVGKA